ncbi:piggyBac transposable element-derived protein 4 [Eupeodes corollae]|uniref:piggyBac transposable element-derived protein 4 n=1 Tax=Eupeodes corollae TaxID=290404 RepID=UPI002492C219|nr:piggyBac transposable element-derived protein 4 [Eupeodes corollae]
MSRNRFQLLLKFIHFADNVSARIPGEILAVDESMIPWRGRLQFRQYNPRKSHKYGVKVYKLCDTNGYTYTSSIYAGKCDNNNQRGRPTESTSHSTQIVLDLADRYLGKGRTMTTDNFYTSLSLAKHLIERETHLVGTLRKNRAGNPKDVTNAKLKKNAIIGRENSGIVIAKWKDKRDVLMLSTKHDLEVISTGKKNRNDDDIKKLKMIMEYNKGKQGIDISDQMACYFTPLRKTIKWYHKIAFEFLLSTSVVNALVIFKQFHKNAQILEFRQSICESLCQLELEPSTSANIKVNHVIKEFETRDKTNRKTRKRCSSCYNDIQEEEGRVAAQKKAKRVSTYCDSCDGKPALCLDCFTKKH